MHLACGLSVGLTGLAAGYCIGIVGDKGVRAYMLQSRIFVGMVLILIFGEVLGLYGWVPLSSPIFSASLTTLTQPHRRAHPQHQEQGLMASCPRSTDSERNLLYKTETGCARVRVLDMGEGTARRVREWLMIALCLAL